MVSSHFMLLSTETHAHFRFLAIESLPTDNNIDGDDLEKSLIHLVPGNDEKTAVMASEFLERMDDPEKAHMVDTLVKFLHLYARHSAPKDESKRFLDRVHSERLRQVAVSDNSDQEDPHAHPCLLDFLTPSDLAYALWQYFNSHKDWKKKHAAKGSATEGIDRYKTNTKWTSNKKVAVTKEGLDIYDLLLKFSRNLKRLLKSSLEEHRVLYGRFRILCNKKALEMGIITAPKANEKGDYSQIDSQSGPVSTTEQTVHSEDLLPNLSQLTAAV